MSSLKWSLKNCKSLPSFNRLADPLNDMMVILYFFLTSMMHPVAIGLTIINPFMPQGFPINE